MRVLQPVTDRKESMALFEALRAQASSGAVAYPNRHVGFRGGGYDCSGPESWLSFCFVRPCRAPISE